jgi:hypothetical protein
VQVCNGSSDSLQGNSQLAVVGRDPKGNINSSVEPETCEYKIQFT